MKTIDTKQLQQLWEQNPQLKVINVLKPEAYAEKHIPDTLNVPRSTERFENKVEELTSGKESPVVVYCASQECDASPKAAEALEKAGFEEVYDYEGGTKQWEEDGKPLASLK